MPRNLCVLAEQLANRSILGQILLRWLQAGDSSIGTGTVPTCRAPFRIPVQQQQVNVEQLFNLNVVDSVRVLCSEHVHLIFGQAPSQPQQDNSCQNRHQQLRTRQPLQNTARVQSEATVATPPIGFGLGVSSLQTFLEVHDACMSRSLLLFTRNPSSDSLYRSSERSTNISPGRVMGFSGV